MKLVQKGSRIYINGRLNNTKYVKDGSDKYITVVIAGQKRDGIYPAAYLYSSLSVCVCVCLDDLIHLQSPRSSTDNREGFQQQQHTNNFQQENLQQENLQQEHENFQQGESEGMLSLNMESVPQGEAN